MRIAHITDLHFQRLDRASWRELFGKRAVGAFNLRVLGRDKHFDERVAQCAVRTIAELRPDFIAITGDLSALALDSEFEAALQALKPLLDSIPSLIIPGNHDIYTKDARARFDAIFGRWMGQRFPSGLQTTTCRDVLFVGMDCCRPTAIGSRGLVPFSQILHLNQILSKETDKRIILLTHYPVVDHNGHEYHKKHTWHSIENAPDLLSVLSRAPQKPCMILHGHAHCGFSSHFEGIPIHNPGSGGRSYQSGIRRSAFNIYDLVDGGKAPITTRYVHDGIEFVEEPEAVVFSSRMNSEHSNPSSYSTRSN